MPRKKRPEVIVVEVTSEGVTWFDGTAHYRGQPTLPPHHQCGEKRPLETEERVQIWNQNEAGTSMLLRNPTCGCGFPVRDPITVARP